MFDNLTRVFNDYGKFLVEEYKDNLILDNKNASDNLYNSVKYIVDTSTKGRFEVKISLLEYWKYIENGRRAGKFPPITAIKEWIKVKPVLPKPMSNGKLPTEQQLTYLISRKIALDGIKPNPILEKSIKSITESMMEFIEEAVIQDIENEIEFIYKEVGLI